MPSEISQRQILYAMTLYLKLEKYNKLVNITEKKQIPRSREQTSGYQWGESGEGQCRGQEVEGTNYWV